MFNDKVIDMSGITSNNTLKNTSIVSGQVNDKNHHLNDFINVNNIMNSNTDVPAFLLDNNFANKPINNLNKRKDVNNPNTSTNINDLSRKSNINHQITTGNLQLPINKTNINSNPFEGLRQTFPTNTTPVENTTSNPSSFSTNGNPFGSS